MYEASEKKLLVHYGTKVIFENYKKKQFLFLNKWPFTGPFFKFSDLGPNGKPRKVTTQNGWDFFTGTVVLWTSDSCVMEKWPKFWYFVNNVKILMNIYFIAVYHVIPTLSKTSPRRKVQLSEERVVGIYKQASVSAAYVYTQVLWLTVWMLATHMLFFLRVLSTWNTIDRLYTHE